MLADSYSQTDSSITVHLNSQAKWNNGEKITTEDVIYTFKMDSILPTAHHNNWKYIKTITDDGDNHISFGIHNDNRRGNRDFVNGIQPVVLLDFNVDGPILDGMPERDVLGNVIG